MEEIVGLLVIILVLFFPLIRRIFKGKKPQKRIPEERYVTRYEAEEEEEPWELQEDLVKPKPKPKPPRSSVPRRSVGKNFEFRSRLESFKRVSKIEQRHLETRIIPGFKESVVSEPMAPRVAKKKPTQATSLDKLLEGRSSYQKMVIMHEILRGSKGMQ